MLVYQRVNHGKKPMENHTQSRLRSFCRGTTEEETALSEGSLLGLSQLLRYVGAFCEVLRSLEGEPQVRILLQEMMLGIRCCTIGDALFMPYAVPWGLMVQICLVVVVAA